MAVSNTFNTLTKATGNFLMFSQYVEDLTRANVERNSYKVIPSKFVALNVDYEGWDNYTLPKHIQDYFENGCALCRRELVDIWTPQHSQNLFWGMMQEKFMTIESENEMKYFKEIKYVGDINIQSYNEHAGLGYSEVYCYIPNDARSHNYFIDINVGEGKQLQSSNVLEGYKEGELNGREIIDPIATYLYDKEYEFSFNSESQLKSKELSDKDFNINTIVVLYDIYSDGVMIYEGVPMGIYFTGLIESGVMSNRITKYVENYDVYDSGTSYGLRICSRYVVAPQGDFIKVDEVSAESDCYAGLTQVLSKLSETTSAIDRLINKTYSQSASYKELYSIFKNSRTNVPYIKKIGNIDYWFVNGKMVGEAGGTSSINYGELRLETSITDPNRDSGNIDPEGDDPTYNRLTIKVYYGSSVVMPDELWVDYGYGFTMYDPSLKTLEFSNHKSESRNYKVKVKYMGIEATNDNPIYYSKN